VLELENPLALLLIPALLAYVTYTHRGYWRRAHRFYSVSNPLFRVLEVKPRTSSRRLSLALKLASVTLLALALASPALVENVKVARTVDITGTEVYRLAKPAVVILLDVSGSMGEQIPGGVKIEVAKAAIARFIDSLPQNLSVGLVAFDHAVELAVPVTSNRTAVKAELSKLSPMGGTMFTYPLYTALNALQPYRVFNASCAAVLVTDGLPADRGLYDDLLRQFASLRIPVYTVYVGPGGDEGEAELRRISGLTGGKSYTAWESEALSQVLAKLAGEISRLSVQYTGKAVVEEDVVVRTPLRGYLLAAALVLYVAHSYLRHRLVKLSF